MIPISSRWGILYDSFPNPFFFPRFSWEIIIYLRFFSTYRIWNHHNIFYVCTVAITLGFVSAYQILDLGFGWNNLLYFPTYSFSWSWFGRIKEKISLFLKKSLVYFEEYLAKVLCLTRFIFYERMEWIIGC